MGTVRAESFPDPKRATLRARIFADDLRKACGRVFDVLGGQAQPDQAQSYRGPIPFEVVCLPITIPIDENGVVVLSTGHVEAPRHPATLDLARPSMPGSRYHYAMVLGRDPPAPLVIPGVSSCGQPAVLGQLTAAVADRGLVVEGFLLTGEHLSLDLDDHTSGLLATALLITLGVKLAKAEHGASPPPPSGPGGDGRAW